MSEVADFYNNLAEKYGIVPKSSDAASAESLLARHEVLASTITIGADISHSTILEVGCGTGSLAYYLTNLNNKYENYTGIDIAEKAVEVAKSLNLPNTDFQVADVLTFEPGIQYDIVLAQGIFYKHKSMKTVCAMIDRMFQLSKGVVAFTAIDTWGEQRDDELRINPVEMLGILRLYSSNIVFRHDYGYDSCFIVNKLD